MAVKFSEITYKNFGRCIKMENEVANLIITVDVGPRIISYSLNGKENMLYEDVDRVEPDADPDYEDYYYKGAKWRLFGGHRLWYSPEAFPETYYPDSNPVPYTIDGNTITLTPKPQTENGVAYQFAFTLEENSSKVIAKHTVTNISNKTKELAPWCLTVMDKQGVQIMPQSTKQTGLLANRLLVLWPYVNVADDRLFFSDKFITLQQNATPSAIKIGFNNEDGWAAYLNKEQLFIKRIDYKAGANYPDFGCSYETYTNENILEIESVAPLAALAPNEAAQHNEIWELVACKESFDRKNVDSIAAFTAKFINRA